MKRHAVRGAAEIAAGAVCGGYYLAAGAARGFGVSALWVWLAASGVFSALGAADLHPRAPRAVRILCTAARAAVCAAAAAFLAVEIPVVQEMNARCPDGVDYLLILGAKVDGEEPGPALAQRIEAARAYLLANPETKAILCGGQGADEGISEAECMRRALTSAGISGDRLILEDSSTSTAENMRFAYALAGAPGVSAGVATSNFHIYRAVRIARSCGWRDVYGLAAPFSGIMLPHYLAREFLTVTVDRLRGNL